MIYKLTFSILVLNIIYEFVEIIFPFKYMNNFIKSTVVLLFLYAVIEIFINYFNLHF